MKWNRKNEKKIMVIPLTTLFTERLMEMKRQSEEF